jgi:hypothetical protein
VTAAQGDGGPAVATVSNPPIPTTDRRALWRWVATSSRPYVGWILAGLGALALFLGWWGVSGQSLTAKQLPYLVSGGLTGIALVIIAAVFLATDDVRRQMVRLDEIERKVDDLYTLLVAEAPPADATADELDRVPAGTKRTGNVSTGAGELIALPTGTSYHRRECALVAGKDTAVVVNAAAIARRSLRPCRVCDPPAPAARR